MVLLLTVSKAQKILSQHTRARRLAMGLTQEGLANRAGVHLPTLRKFEQKGLISLESFLKLLMVVGGLDEVVKALEPSDPNGMTIGDILNTKEKKSPKKGWRK